MLLLQVLLLQVLLLQVLLLQVLLQVLMQVVLLLLGRRWRLFPLRCHHCHYRRRRRRRWSGTPLLPAAGLVVEHVL